MSLILNIVLGLAITAAGAGITLKSEWFYENFGAIAWAEEKLGSSRLFYKLLGILVAFIGIMVATGLWRGFLMGTLGTLLRRGN
jgi:hypothetical protein